MQGFNPKFKDFPDYILGITHEIWEEKQVETLYHYYSDDIPGTFSKLSCYWQ
jgi:hypothetical protein